MAGLWIMASSSSVTISLRLSLGMYWQGNVFAKSPRGTLAGFSA